MQVRPEIVKRCCASTDLHDSRSWSSFSGVTTWTGSHVETQSLISDDARLLKPHGNFRGVSISGWLQAEVFVSHVSRAATVDWR